MSTKQIAEFKNEPEQKRIPVLIVSATKPYIKEGYNHVGLDILPYDGADIIRFTYSYGLDFKCPKLNNKYAVVTREKLIGYNENPDTATTYEHDGMNYYHGTSFIRYKAFADNLTIISKEVYNVLVSRLNKEI